MSSLARGVLRFPQQEPFKIDMGKVGDLAETGLDSQMVNGRRQNGPFEIRMGNPGVRAYKALWSHHAGKKAGDRERRLEVPPDSCGVVRKGMRGRALKIWERTASRLHANRDFRLNSQSLAMCMTRELTIGGRAWPALIPSKDEFVWPLVLWGNSTLGLMSFWQLGNRQQAGRSSLTLSKLPELLTVDATTLSRSQIDAFESLYRRFKKRVFLPANEAYRDPARVELDASLFEILGLPDRLLSGLEIVRLQWCSEPTVHGGKGTKPTLS